jgi:hypothetical protein
MTCDYMHEYIWVHAGILLLENEYWLQSAKSYFIIIINKYLFKIQW